MEHSYSIKPIQVTIKAYKKNVLVNTQSAELRLGESLLQRGKTLFNTIRENKDNTSAHIEEQNDEFFSCEWCDLHGDLRAMEISNA